MCGICGVVDLDLERPVDAGVLQRMNRALRHRGPDEEGYREAPHVALAMCRLRVIDPAGGSQPMSNEAGSVWLVYNGEVYNFRELRRQLEARGHRFRTRSDTEVVVHGYEAFGVEVVTRLRGMFAFALWDGRQQRLLLARDRLGIKPLYYWQKGGRLAFASELKSLLKLPDFPREVDPEAVDLYLTYGYVPAPWTPFRGVRKLAPGHVLVLDQAGARVQNYWDFVPAERPSRPLRESVAELRARLQDAIRSHLVSDVPVGAFLSGGLDSSTVVALMSLAGAHPVRTFSVGFREARFDELPYARQVARRYGTDHRELVVEPQVARRLPELLSHFDEPFGDSSAIATYLVAELARQHVTVVLTGDGGDEVFCGYEWQRRHQMVRPFHRLPFALRARAPRLAGLLPAGPWRQRAAGFLADVALHPADGYLRRMTLFDRQLRRELYSSGFRAALDGHESLAPLRMWLDALPESDFRNRMLYADTHFYCPEDCLVKVDRMTMAWSLEARVPLLDHELVEFLASIPPQWKLRGVTSKYLLRRAVRDLLPRDLLRKRKQGFSVPVGPWLRGPLFPAARDLLLDARARQRGWLRPEAVERLLEEHRSGGAEHGHRLYAVLGLEIWAREYLDRVPAAV
ncbi:MAG: asparagine synthase (glutamine-hydrolyzing) [Armatimonadota bacterium]|nr:asparagine synthase (glutamine-hydrolyzing) [Armatimonadota bacterium]